MDKLTIQDVQLKDQRVLIRVDFNVPLDENLNITDDIRIKAAVPTIKFALEKGAKKVILMSHLGRPDGKVVAKYSLKPAAKRLQELLGQPVKQLDDCVGDKVKEETNVCPEKVVLLENLRFYAQEEANDAAFAKQLSELGDIFINDAFGTAHRAHASTEGVTHYLRSAAGFLLEKEIQYLGEALKNPARPFVVILGGAKVSDKIAMIENMLPKADTILVGGGMAYTFLKAMGKPIGNSKLEKDRLDIATDLIGKGKDKIVLPIDHIVVDKVDPAAKTQITSGQDIPEGMIAVDIGPKTIQLFEDKLKDAKTIVWNGPLGIFEMEPFSKGTRDIAEFIAALKTTSIIGGGDTAAAIAKFKVEEKMTHISTGGGASLEFLEGKTLPAIAALTAK